MNIHIAASSRLFMQDYTSNRVENQQSVSSSFFAVVVSSGIGGQETFGKEEVLWIDIIVRFVD